MANRKISELNTHTPDGTEYVECIIAPYSPGTNRRVTTQDIANLGGGAVNSVNGQTGTVVLDITTREFDRAFSQTINFDKNEIYYVDHVATGDVTFQIGTGLSNQTSTVRLRVYFDGTQTINFGAGFDFLYGVTNGEILEAGLYEIYINYTNGSASVSIPGVTAQQSGATQLMAPGSFAAVVGSDPQTEIDLSWADVANEASYEIQYSSTGGTGPWIPLTNPAAGSTSYTHTGLTPGSTYHYRIRAVGDGLVYTDSAYSIDATTTQAAGDVTAPTFTFFPADAFATWSVNEPITLTANEPIRNTDGSEITNANVATRLTLKETNSGGANIAFSATIDITKTIITITPTTIYGTNQLVYVAINNVEDTSGNEVTVAISSTFTTTEYSFFNGTSNYLRFGDILDSVWAAADTKFKLRITINDSILSGTRFLIGKYSSSDNQRSFYWYYTGTDVYFSWARTATSVSRSVKWTNVLTAGEHDLEIVYDGSIDTNDGLDRVTLNIDASPAGSKSMFFTNEVLGDIFNSTAQLSFATGVNNSGSPAFALYYAYEAKDLMVLSGVADTVEINVPVLRTGTDTSGNARNGTWV